MATLDDNSGQMLDALSGNQQPTDVDQYNALQAIKELAERELCRRKLLNFVCRANPAYDPGWVHHVICEAIEEFERQIHAAMAAKTTGPRLLITLPPRHGKSEIASRCFPAWYLGRNPQHEIIATSYSANLALKFSRTARALYTSPMFRSVFPGADLDRDARAAENWLTRENGGYLAAGVGGSITGSGMHCGIVDDPLKNREEAESETIRESIIDWYTSTFYTRLAPGGGIIVIQCMTGDTDVLMGCGKTKKLKNIEVGDLIATYDAGKLNTTRVVNFSNNGPDFVYKITMSSGKILKANARHPFLSVIDGETQWVSTKQLKPGMHLFRINLENGVSGKEKSVWKKAAMKMQNLVATVIRITTKDVGRLGIDLLLVEKTPLPESVLSLNTDTVLRSKSIKKYLGNRMGGVPYVKNLQNSQPAQNTGIVFFALTTATIREKLEDFFATIATWWSAKIRHQKCWKAPHNTSDFKLEKISDIEILPAKESVYDIQVERTENFIANGFVSHNTRWHEADLAGWLLEEMEKRTGDKFVHLNFPAIAEEDEAHRKKGEALHTARYPLDVLQQIQRVIGDRDFASLYQQRPAAAEGDQFKRSMLHYYDEDKLPPKEEMTFYQAWDFAIGQKQLNDWTVGICVGIDKHDNIWVVDLVRGRWDSLKIVDEMLDLWELWQAERVGLEHGQIAMALDALIEKRIAERNMWGFPYNKDENLKPGRQDKVARSAAIRGRMRQRKVFLPREAPWLSAFTAELLVFPNGKNDDQVDALSWIGVMMNLFYAPREQAPDDTLPKWLKKILNKGRHSQHSSGASAMGA